MSKNVFNIGVLSGAFAVVSNAALVGGITTALRTINITLAPLTLETASLIGGTALLSGTLITTYKKHPPHGLLKSFTKSILGHTALGALAGGAGYALVTLTPFLNLMEQPPQQPRDPNYRTYVFDGVQTTTKTFNDGSLVIATPDNAPDINIYLNPSQAATLARQACKEMQDCRAGTDSFQVTTASASAPMSIAALPYDSLNVDLTAATECDISCANGQAGISCINITNSNESAIQVKFDMEQAEEIVRSYCEKTGQCSMPEALPLSEPEKEKGAESEVEAKTPTAPLSTVEASPKLDIAEEPIPTPKVVEPVKTIPQKEKIIAPTPNNQLIILPAPPKPILILR